MPHSKYLHTQSGLTACGTRSGRGPLGFHDNLRSCIKFDDGSWTTLTDNLLAHRYGHSSWVTPKGDILLIGGTVSLTTTEIVYKDGTSIRSFDLKYKTRYVFIHHCIQKFSAFLGNNTISTIHLKPETKITFTLYLWALIYHLFLWLSVMTLQFKSLLIIYLLFNKLVTLWCVVSFSGGPVPLRCLNCSFWLGDIILWKQWADIQPADGWKIFRRWMMTDIPMVVATFTMMICKGWVLDIKTLKIKHVL